MGSISGRCSTCAAEAASELPPELAHLADLLRDVLPKLGRGYAHVDAHYEDAGWVANRWAEVLPLKAEEKLVLLELEDAARASGSGGGLVSPAARGCG